MSDNLPALNDHAFMRMLRDQCSTNKPMTRIAAELGVDVDALCNWIMAYKAPKKAKPYLNRHSEPITYEGRPIRSGVDYRRESQKFAAWRKATEGAARTAKMHEVAGR